MHSHMKARIHGFSALIAAVVLLSASLVPAMGQTLPQNTAAQPGMQSMPSHQGTAMTPNHQEMMQSMEKMNRDMTGAPMTGNPDRDFIAMMMPHHQGAIDMARIYLRDGKDPAIRRMAQKVITDQEREIREMRNWQAKHPVR